MSVGTAGGSLHSCSVEGNGKLSIWKTLATSKPTYDEIRAFYIWMRREDVVEHLRPALIREGVQAVLVHCCEDLKPAQVVDLLMISTSSLVGVP